MAGPDLLNSYDEILLDVCDSFSDKLPPKEVDEVGLAKFFIQMKQKLTYMLIGHFFYPQRLLQLCKVSSGILKTRFIT